MRRNPAWGYIVAAFGAASAIGGTVAPAAAACAWQTVQMAQLPAAGSASAISAAAFDDVWAVGSYSSNSGYQHAFAQRFDGSAWTTVRVPGLGLGGVRTFSKTDAWAVGVRSFEGFVLTLAVHWDGSAWHTVRTPNENNSEDVLDAIGGTSPNDLWATGWYFDPNTHATLTLAEHWNGSVWSIVKTPNPALQNELLGVYAAAANDVWAVGLRDNVGGTQGAPLIEHWNGTRWKVIDDPATPFQAYAALTAIGGNSSSDVWAVGAGFVGQSSPSSTLAMHFDGTAWAFVPSPNVGTGSNLLDGVVTDDTGKAVAVGASSFGSSAQAVLVERWNGRQWSVDRPALTPTYSRLNAVSLGARDELWAAGYAGRRPFAEFDCGG